MRARPAPGCFPRAPRAGLCALAALLALFSGDAVAAVYEVNVTDDLDDGLCDGAHCSLREAIDAANQTPSSIDSIEFANPAGSGPMVILPTDPLPVIEGPLLINGFACTDCGSPSANSADPEDGYDSELAVAIDGSSITTGSWTTADGLLTAAASPVTLVGLNIRNSPGSGVVFSSGGGSLEDCYVGTDLSGSTAMPNVGHGLLCVGCSMLLDDTHSLFSGNGLDGIHYDNPNVDDENIEGQIVGLSADTRQAVGNGRHGIFISNDSSSAIDNFEVSDVGLEEVVLVGGNGADGIHIEGRVDMLSIRNAWIGMNAFGDDLGNGGDGIHLAGDGGAQVWVHEDVQILDNRVGNNGEVGIRLHEVRDVVVQGNGVGTNLAGQEVAPNGDGIVVQGDAAFALNILLGHATSPFQANTIANNLGDGV